MKKLIVSIIFVFGLFCAVTANADQKSYVWTVEYQTLPKGGAEVEYWLTAATADARKSSETDYQHQVELEYGITNNWDMSLYQIFDQAGHDALQYQGLKLETRYSFGESGKYIVDPLIYIEYKPKIRGQETIEGKLVLAKQIGKLNVSYNQIVEAGIGKGGSAEHEYAAGISYQVYHSLGLAIEDMGSFTKHEHAIGPTLSWAGGRFWATAGVAFGLNKRTDDRQVRMIIGIPF